MTKECRDKRLYCTKVKWLYARVDKNGDICDLSDKISDVIEGKRDTDKIFNLSIDYLNSKFHIFSQLENFNGKSTGLGVFEF